MTEGDLADKEEVLIKKVHEEYLKADNKGEFFEELQNRGGRSRTWYYDKFQKYEFTPDSGVFSEMRKQEHAQRKISDMVSDLDEMEDSIPELEMDPSLLEGIDYVDPGAEKKKELGRIKEEILEMDSSEVLNDVNYGKYQETKRQLDRFLLINESDFDVSQNYKTMLEVELKKIIRHLSKVLEELND